MYVYLFGRHTQEAESGLLSTYEIIEYYEGGKHSAQKR